MTISTYVAFIFGVIITSIVFAFTLRMQGRKSDGILKIDYANPDKDVYLLEVHSPLDEIHLKKRVIFKVVIDE